MRVCDSEFFCEALRYIGYGCSMGWHERNAGNLSMRLTAEEICSVRDDFSPREWISLPETVDAMRGEYIFTTVSGSYFVDMNYNCESKFCICEISDTASEYRIVWGGEKPTSEFFGHLLSLSNLKQRGTNRAIYHAHPSNIVALSFILPQNEKAISEAIWSSITECAFVLPKGIGVIGFYIPGSIELARATASKTAEYDAILWSSHGVFACGESFSAAFGLVHAIEKSAEIYLKVISSGQEKLNCITKELQKETAGAFGYALNEFEE